MTYTDGASRLEIKVNACEPGFGASCALCCGSHNFNASLSEMEEIFRLRSEKVKLYSRDYLLKQVSASRSDMTGSYSFFPKRSVDLPAVQPLFMADLCTFTGFVTSESNIIGCLLHEGREGALRHDCPRNYSSKNFICPAKEGLTSEEILFAAELFRDWFYYSLLIHSCDLLSHLTVNYLKPGDLPADEIISLREILDNRRVTDESLHRLGSYF